MRLLLALTFTLTPLSYSCGADTITRVWLTHGTTDPSKIYVNWFTDEPAESVVEFGATAQLGQRAADELKVRLHQIEIPIIKTADRMHYVVKSGQHSSKPASFKTYSQDELKVGVVANWHRHPKLDAIMRDNVHLLMTAGDNIPNLHRLCGVGAKDCIKPYLKLIDAYPDMFQSLPFMPVLGNHDREIRTRGKRFPPEPVYDIDATAFCRMFPLPGSRWKWHFEIQDFNVVFTAVDLNHLSDFGTTWQTCHSFGKGSEQLTWIDKTLRESRQTFRVVLYNAQNIQVRRQAKGDWGRALKNSTVAITGFGYFAERAEPEGFACYNTSLSGKGAQYKDPKSAFVKGEDNYLLLTFKRSPQSMKVEIKNLSGEVLDAKTYKPPAAE